jgi:hypothetical protein
MSLLSYAFSTEERMKLTNGEANAFLRFNFTSYTYFSIQHSSGEADSRSKSQEVTLLL